MVTIEEVRAAKTGSMIMISEYRGYKIPEEGIAKDEKGREFLPGDKQQAYIRERNGHAYIWLFAPISQYLDIEEIISYKEWEERIKKLNEEKWPIEIVRNSTWSH